MSERFVDRISAIILTAVSVGVLFTILTQLSVASPAHEVIHHLPPLVSAR